MTGSEPIDNPACDEALKFLSDCAVLTFFVSGSIFGLAGGDRRLP